MTITGNTLKKEEALVPPERSEGERSEPLRSGGGTNAIAHADPEVDSKASRRQFSAAYKRRILEEADKGGQGTIAGLLRREGLYSSHLATWRKLRANGELAGLEPRKRGKKPVARNPLAAENDSLPSVPIIVRHLPRVNLM